MKVRLATLITACAAAVLWYAEPLKSENLTGTCISSKAPWADVIAACTAVIADTETTIENRNAFFAKRAEAHYQMGEYDQSVADFSTALNFEPSNSRVLVWRAYAHSALGDHKAADADFDTALKNDKNDVHALFNRAKIFRMRDELDKAEAGIERVLRLEPQHQDATKLLVDLKNKMNKPQQLAALLDHARNEWPTATWPAIDSILFYLSHERDVSSALTVAEEFVRDNPNSTGALFLLGFVQLNWGYDQEGLDTAREFASLDIDKSLRKLNFFSRLYRKITNWLVVGQNEEWLVQAIFLARLGRDDLANAELEKFLHSSGKNGRKLLLHVIRRKGISVPEQADAGSADHILSVISKFTSFHREQGGMHELALTLSDLDS